MLLGGQVANPLGLQQLRAGQAALDEFAVGYGQLVRLLADRPSGQLFRLRHKSLARSQVEEGIAEQAR